MLEHRLRLAQQYCDDAKLLLQNERWNSGVARAYYASYQAMWAALGDPPQEEQWRHLAIIKHFVRGYWFDPAHPSEAPGLLEPLRLSLRKLYLARIQCDYEGSLLNQKTAKAAIQAAEETLRVIEERRKRP